MSTIAEKAAAFWRSSEHPALFEPALVDAIREAVAKDPQGIMLCDSPERYSQQGTENILQMVAEQFDLPLSSFREALMYVYPTEAEYKTSNAGRFRDL